MKSHKSKRQKIYYPLPLEWSLYYVMSSGEWNDFKARIKELNPNWQKCSCPKQCAANSLDEVWKYDKRKHIKRFLKAQFLCRGCHWFKSRTWRVETWIKDELGILAPPDKTPHIFSCLGKTKQQVRKLREKDLNWYQKNLTLNKQMKKDIRTGKANIGRWTADLSGLKQYGYDEIDISAYSAHMFAKARSRKKEKGARNH